ncbi:MAG: hypothetical protein JKY88_01090 [Pseudomonadales bacterium]|nr:hypothetical protein [Pseudomonadales bacterium]
MGVHSELDAKVLDVGETGVIINGAEKRIIFVSANALQQREGEELVLVAQASASLRILESEIT